MAMHKATVGYLFFDDALKFGRQFLQNLLFLNAAENARREKINAEKLVISMLTGLCEWLLIDGLYEALFIKSYNHALSKEVTKTKSKGRVRIIFVISVPFTACRDAAELFDLM